MIVDKGRLDISRDIGVLPMVEVIVSTQRVEIIDYDLVVIASLLFILKGFSPSIPKRDGMTEPNYLARPS